MVNDQEPRYRLVDADGDVVGSLFAESDGTLKLQEGTSGNDNELALTTQGALEAEQFFSDPVAVRLTKTSNQTINAGTLTEVTWDTSDELNASAPALADLSNNGVTVPNDDFDYARARFQILTDFAVTVSSLRFRKNGAKAPGIGDIAYDMTNARTANVASSWVPVSSGDTLTAEMELDTQADIRPNSRTFLSVELR